MTSAVSISRRNRDRTFEDEHHSASGLNFTIAAIVFWNTKSNVKLNGMRAIRDWSAWTEAHMRYLRELVLPHPAMKVILEDYLMAISAAQERIQRCETAIIDRLSSWRLKPAVDALMAFKGFQLLAAMITVSELGALHRFDHPRQLMAYLGLVPSESTSSDKCRKGAITKTGNSNARWILIECANITRHRPRSAKNSRTAKAGNPVRCSP